MLACVHHVPAMPEAWILIAEPHQLQDILLLEDVEGGTLVTVVESGFDRIALERRAKVFEDNSKGWEIQLDSLAEYVPKTT